MTHLLVREGALGRGAVTICDVGMRGGIQEHWKLLRDQARFVGFEPDADQCALINAGGSDLIRCYPVALDTSTRRRVLVRHGNHAGDSFYPRGGVLPMRFGVADPAELSAGPSQWLGDTPRDGATVETTSLADFAQREGFTRVDFLKLDVEGAELDVLRGAGPFLGPGGAIGIEAELCFAPLTEAPRYNEVAEFLETHGYLLYAISLMRASRRTLPAPLAWDHRDQDGRPILYGGPTTRGQITHCDAAFFRDLIADGFVPREGHREDLIRILTAAAFYEIYNLADCAAELLVHYRPALESLVDVEMLLTQLVPIEADGITLGDYLRAYPEDFARSALPGAKIKRRMGRRLARVARHAAGWCVSHSAVARLLVSALRRRYPRPSLLRPS